VLYCYVLAAAIVMVVRVYVITVISYNVFWFKNKFNYVLYFTLQRYNNT